MNRLKELRQKKGDTQEVVAKAMGVTRRGYQKWENGESQIKPDKAQQLADYFGVSVGHLLGYEDYITIQNEAFDSYRNMAKLLLTNPDFKKLVEKDRQLAEYLCMNYEDLESEDLGAFLEMVEQGISWIMELIESKDLPYQPKSGKKA